MINRRRSRRNDLAAFVLAAFTTGSVSAYALSVPTCTEFLELSAISLQVDDGPPVAPSLPIAPKLRLEPGPRDTLDGELFDPALDRLVAVTLTRIQ